MKRIALILENPLNKGDMAVVISTVETLKTIIPNSQISVFSSSPQGIDKYKNHSINFTKSPWKTKAETIFINLIMSGLKCISIIGMYTANFLLKPFGIAGFRDPLDYDLFIENGTDIHTYGGMSFYYSLYPLLLNMLFRKPLVIYAESLGPFKNNMERSLMKFILNRASLITIRESISYAFLQELKLKNSAYLTADPAFLLKSCCQERVDKIFIEEGINDIRKPVIGIFVSELICRRAFGNHVKPKERRRKYFR